MMLVWSLTNHFNVEIAWWIILWTKTDSAFGLFSYPSTHVPSFRFNECMEMQVNDPNDDCMTWCPIKWPATRVIKCLIVYCSHRPKISVRVSVKPGWPNGIKYALLGKVQNKKSATLASFWGKSLKFLIWEINFFKYLKECIKKSQG